MALRKLIRRFPDASLAAGEIAFWLVLALAIAVGGASVVRGAPVLADLLVPPGLMAAEASGESPAHDVALPVEVANASLYSPQVLTPVASHGFPDWLAERVRQLRGGKPAVPPARMPAIAIVIDDVGQDADAAARAIALPKPVSLAFLPYPEETPSLARAAVRAGHQILLHMPMEPEGNADPGPGALLTSLNADQITGRLDLALARVPGFSGINNHMGSLFTQDRAALAPVMKRLSDLHVFFLDSMTTPKSEGTQTARLFGVASAGRDVFLDDVETAPAIAAQLAETEAHARADGVAIAIGHPHAVTLDALAEWTKNLRGFRLVPVSVAIGLKSEIE
ncbi:MAG TPA: divergent polysaccharide deacetylase family protein, partial [Rhizomicrobium sp.]|nr:divergent polysaccharide deacetylase family protein [Rhizomicrobium sp.]